MLQTQYNFSFTTILHNTLFLMFSDKCHTTSIYNTFSVLYEHY